MAEAARAAGVTYIVEPLSRLDTGLMNTVEEALTLIAEIGSPALSTMIDCYAAASNGEDVATLLARWLPRNVVSHIHFNDDNKLGPGQGGIDFSAVIATLRAHGYAATAAVEPFIYEPDGAASAARAIGYLHGIRQALDRKEQNGGQ